MDLRDLMKQAQQMQEQMQQEMTTLEVEASVGGGMVTVRMNGSKALTSVRIDPDVLDPGDAEMVQDLVLSAVNEASRKVDEEMQGKLGSLAPGLGKIPGFGR